VILTSVTAWRTWNWDPSSDRDFTGLSIQTASANPDNQNQYSQEFRLESSGQQTVDWLVGLYYFRQKIDATPLAQYGADATRWLLSQDLTLPPNLLDGYRADGEAHSDTKSYAAFSQATWNIERDLHFTAGLRYTYEGKTGSFDQLVSGGLTPANANELARKNSIAREQHYQAAFTDGSFAGTAAFAYDVTEDVHAYLSYSKGHKSGGINLAGIPVDAAGNPILTTAVIKPEDVSSVEVGLKNQFFSGRLTINLAAFETRVRDYQVNVVDSGPGALRGYLSNIEKVSSRGIELDSAFVTNENFSGYLSAAWTEGKYVSFVNGPCPLERTTGATVACDLSGRRCPDFPKGQSRPVANTGIRHGAAWRMSASTRAIVRLHTQTRRIPNICASTAIALSMFARVTFHPGRGKFRFGSRIFSMPNTSNI
jgi:iron complex outermembrane recepter protein